MKNNNKHNVNFRFLDGFYITTSKSFKQKIKYENSSFIYNTQRSIDRVDLKIPKTNHQLIKHVNSSIRKVTNGMCQISAV